ncbi:MAG TPA: DUF721 domain-containing protein [Desulfobulbus sp.]|nr:DUF721 domain-containing protein [Desulfobulbus sp.]
MKKRERQQQLVGQCLPQVVNRHIGPAFWRFYLLARQWEDLVGAELAAHVTPAWLRRDTLWLYVDGSAWMQEISFIQPDLLPKINASLQSTVVREIRCLQRPQETTGVPQKTPIPNRAVNREEEQAFRRMTENIPDPQCGRALLKLWRAFQVKGR